MAGFTFVKRACTRCGREYEALEWWEKGLCGKCSLDDYNAMITRLSVGKPYSIDSIGGMCPTQAEGLTQDGRYFYFRARHGQWTLHATPEHDDVYLSPPIASGEDETHGNMEAAAVVAILDEHLKGNA